MANTLYYGDNLDMLRWHVGDESVDLVYLDPPFKSNRDYNVLFAEQDGSRSAWWICAGCSNLSARSTCIVTRPAASAAVPFFAG